MRTEHYTIKLTITLVHNRIKIGCIARQIAKGHASTPLEQDVRETAGGGKYGVPCYIFLDNKLRNLFFTDEYRDENSSFEDTSTFLCNTLSDAEMWLKRLATYLTELEKFRKEQEQSTTFLRSVWA